MRNDDELTPMELEIETALKGLSLVNDDSARDELMYRAGHLQGRREITRWRSMCAVALAALVIVSFRSAKSPKPASFVEVGRRAVQAPAYTSRGDENVVILFPYTYAAYQADLLSERPSMVSTSVLPDEVGSPGPSDQARPSYQELLKSL